MVKAHCSKHKRYVHNCPGCQSEALRETVGFPKTEGEAPEESEETAEGAPGPDAEEEDEEGSDIAEWEPEVEDDPAPTLLPSYVPAGEGESVLGEEAIVAEDRDAAIDAAEEAFDADDSKPLLTPGEGEPDIHRPTEMTPLEAAMFMFPRRLIPEGATEVCDEEHPDEPYMASYEELVRRALAGYLEMGLSPEDAVIVVAAEVIKAEQLGNQVAIEGDDALTEEELEAFDAGLEAAPELTGCIEDYNQGYNDGMAALLSTLRGYYAGDEDAVAYATMQWLEAQMVGMKK